MGWKAAQKLIQKWKILRGDNVTSAFFLPFLLSRSLLLPFVSSSDQLLPPIWRFSPPVAWNLLSKLRKFCVCWLVWWQVMIIRGKDKGETGMIKRVIHSQNRVIVGGKILVKKHIKQGHGHEGGIFTVEAPLHVSNVQVLDTQTGKPCKIGIRYLEDGTKVRIYRGIGASGSIIPRPEILKIRTTPRPSIVGPKDTLMDLVLEKTFDAKAGIGMPDL